MDEGRTAGINHAQDGRSFNSACYNDSLVFCAGYKAGYIDGYRSANIVGSNQD